jgi:hypothetical protein
MKEKIIKSYKLLLSILSVVFVSYTIALKYFFTLNLSIFLLKSILILSLLLQICFLYRNSKVNLFVFINKKLNNFYHIFYWEPLKYFYNEIIEKIPHLGDKLYIIGHGFTKICIMLGKNAIIILGLFLYILPNIFIILGLLYNTFFINPPISFIYFFIIPISFFILRIASFFLFLMDDFATKNMNVLNNLLIITKLNKAYKYDFNYKVIKNPTQEKLILYSNRYEVFRDLHIFLSAFLFHKYNNLLKFVKPFAIATFFICSFNYCLLLFDFSVNSLIIFIIFVIIALKEHKNNK